MELGMGIEPSLSGGHRHFHGFFAAFFPFFPSQGKSIGLPRRVWRKVKKMNRKIVNCPHCGKILSPDIWEEKSSMIQKPACPRCHSQRVWKSGKLKPKKYEFKENKGRRSCEN